MAKDACASVIRFYHVCQWLRRFSSAAAHCAVNICHRIEVLTPGCMLQNWMVFFLVWYGGRCSPRERPWTTEQPHDSADRLSQLSDCASSTDCAGRQVTTSVNLT
jgi:hypothetical protein